MKKNILLEIHYDGTNYHGLQIQPNKITIEEVLTKTISKILNQNIKLQYSGRTDAGVHSFCNVMNFKYNSDIVAITLKKMKYAFNSLLPKDIRIYNLKEVSLDFNSRYNVISREYRYYICNSDVISPFFYRYYLHYPHKINFCLMSKACSIIKGNKDFDTFRASDCCANTSIRNITELEILNNKKNIIFNNNSSSHKLYETNMVDNCNNFYEPTKSNIINNFNNFNSLFEFNNSNIIEIRIVGNAFLKNMVRIIVGTLLEINENKINLSELEDIINSKDRRRAGRTAPAHGLFLYNCQIQY